MHLPNQGIYFLKNRQPQTEGFNEIIDINKNNF